MGESSCQITNGLSVLRRQAAADDALDKFLGLVQSPFKQSFTTDAFLASLGTSLGISLFVFCIWCLLRPYHSLVYAPKLRHADEKRAPPAIGKGYFSWVHPLMKCHEEDLVEKIGMDATIFLRFMRLCRSLFFFLGILGCVVMIPVNVSCNLKNEQYQSTEWKSSTKWYILMSPTYTWGQCMWAHVIVAWTFDFIIMFFLWKNYRHVVRLRRNYFESPEYTDSLHSRTLMIWNVPTSSRSDAGLNKIVGGLGVLTDGKEKCTIGRNVKELPSLIEKHEMAARKLEEILAKYLKHPERLPPRPICSPDKDDKSMADGAKVDAIEYYKHRIEELERQIAIVRKSIDRRDAMSYGFVSFPTISRAHITAKAARGKHPKGTSIKLATKPQDIIWDNLARGKASRRWNGFLGNLLFFLLSVFFVIPNALIAVFLSNLNNIALIWPSFTPILARNSKFFAIVQGFAAPTVTSIIYLLLPIIMRRLSAWQGPRDITKSSRERHVTHKLYVFFIINNLIMFTLFGTLWTTVRGFINIAQKTDVNWEAIRGLKFGDNVAIAIFDVSTFWITYLLQRNLGAILDLAQVVSLIGKSFTVRFLSPTPRQKIEWTAPSTFDYSTYYNYFLFYTTVALCFSTVQPLVLPVAFIYFLVDSFFKKYTLMYIFVTKVESGGTFWRLIFNRLLFATGLFNCVVALIVWSRYNGRTASTVLPLLLILIGFKVYCHRTFDLDTRYYTQGSDRDSMISANQFSRKYKLEMRYCHPALHRKLMKPMVHGKAEHLLAHIYGNADPTPSAGSGGINMDAMQQGHPGKKLRSSGFEIVQEEDMDFANFKNRAEFGEEHGAGTIYGDDYSIGTMTPPPGFGSPASSRPGSPVSRPLRAQSPFVPPTPSGYRGVEYIPATGPAPPQSPGFSHRSFHQAEGPYDYSTTDGRSETGSVTHLLGEHHRHQQPGLAIPPLDPDDFEQPQHSPQRQPYHYETYEDHRGVR